LRSKARKKCNTEKRLKLKKFEAQRLERIVAKMDEVRKHTMEISSVTPLPLISEPKAVIVKVSVLPDENLNKPSAGGITKKRTNKRQN